MAKSKQLCIELRAQREIFSKEGYTQRQIDKKLKISRDGVQYSLEIQLETGANVDSWNTKSDDSCRS